MARFRGSIATDRPVEDLFAYMADVRNFAAWDPGTRAVTQTAGDGPGATATYRVEAEAGPVTLELGYQVTEYDEPRLLVLEARTRWMELRDEITVRPSNGAGAVVTYEARVDLQGVLKLFDAVFSRMFRRTGERAAEGLQQVLGGQRVDG